MTASSEEATPEATVVPETPPDAPAPQRPAQKPQAASTQDHGPVIPTGFPEPAQETTAPVKKPARPGYVTLATVPPMGDLTVPPLEGGGETATITRDGTEVDDATAARAHEAAQLAGFTLTET